MKKTVYKGAYRVVSALSDLTGGASPVTKWKVALGVVIMGLSTGVMTGCEPQTTCYDPAIPPGEEGTDTRQEPGQNPGTGQGDDPDVMCYAPALPPDDQN